MTPDPRAASQERPQPALDVDGRDEERMAFKRQEREAAASIMAGDRYCPDPELHELVARAASQERPSIDVEPGANVRMNGHLFVHVAACECEATQAEVARLTPEDDSAPGPVGECQRFRHDEHCTH